MNDPHVSVLIYRVRHDETVNYDKASPLEYETASFKVSIKGCDARFEMKEHFPTAEQAREAVEPFICQWEFAAALDRDPGEFELVFLGAVVEDRKPTPDVPKEDVTPARGWALDIIGREANDPHPVRWPEAGNRGLLGPGASAGL
jgi:hypothetical protein